MAKKGWKRKFKYALWALGALAAPAIFYLTAAVLLGLIPVNRSFRNAEIGTEVLVVSNGVHVDFILPVRTPLADWSEDFPTEQFGAVFPAHRHLYFGWGERNFYINTPTWDDARVSTISRALLWPTSSAMHVQYLWRTPEPGDDVKRLILTDEQYRTLVRLIRESFAQSSDGKFILIPGKAYGGTDNFYEGAGSYHAFNTCNMWTNRLLAETGVTTAAWSPFAAAILYHLE